MKQNIGVANGMHWQITEQNEGWIRELSQKLKISDNIARLIAPRTSSIIEAANFLDPKISNLMPDPLHLIDMEKGVQRTYHAITNQEKIHIFADYDVDGATSSALLRRTFEDIGIEVEIYVPDRVKEGYGPNSEAIEKISNQGAKLLIIVDCGTSSHDALARAQELKLDVIVIDHHQSAEMLPPAVAVINPNRLDEKSSCTDLAAVGVSFLFAAGLVSYCKSKNLFDKKPAPNLLNYLDLVGLGTVCDVMNLTGLNRAFVRQGLKIMQSKKNLGIQSILDTAQINQEITSYHLGYVIGPRINAGGRVGKSNLGAEILSTGNPEKAKEIATQLEIYNGRRKEIENEILLEATSIAETQKDDALIFIVGKNWHQGVIGIIAGRIKEKFSKPVVIATNIDDTIKASCRSIPGINFAAKLIDAKQEGLVIAGGGHAMAAGFTSTTENADKLHKFLNAQIKQDMQNISDKKILNYDLNLSIASFNDTMIEYIEALHPFGNGNPKPLALVEDLYILNPAIVGAKHVKCILASANKDISKGRVNAIAFGATATPISDVLLSRHRQIISVVGSPEINHWQGRKNLQFVIKDVIITS